MKRFGSAAPSWGDGPEYEHYIHVDDATPSLFGLGQDGARPAQIRSRRRKMDRAGYRPQAEITEQTMFIFVWKNRQIAVREDS